MYDLHLYHLSRIRSRRDSQFWQVWTGCNVANQYAKKGKALKPNKILGLRIGDPDTVEKEKDSEIEDIPGETRIQRSIRVAAARAAKLAREELSQWEIGDVDK